MALALTAGDPALSSIPGIIPSESRPALAISLSSNPVQRWMQHSSPDSNAMLLARLDDQLSEIAARSALPGTPLLSPSFITGRVNVGDPGQVHWDDYDSFALVVLGCKTFFIAPPSAFSSASSTRRGHSHVLPGLSPFDAPPEVLAVEEGGSLFGRRPLPSPGVVALRFERTPFSHDEHLVSRRAALTSSLPLGVPRGSTHVTT